MGFYFVFVCECLWGFILCSFVSVCGFLFCVCLSFLEFFNGRDFGIGFD